MRHASIQARIVAGEDLAVVTLLPMDGQADACHANRSLTTGAGSPNLAEPCHL
jgi:hypothetical protein